jgi:hypothetical protein
MKTLFYITIFLFAAGIQCTLTPATFTKDFFAGYNAQEKLSTDCLNWSEFSHALTSETQDMLEFILINLISNDFFNECKWNSAINELNEVFETKTRREIINAILTFKSSDEHFRKLYQSIKERSINATALGALLTEVAHPSEVESFHSEKFRNINLDASDIEREIFALMQNATYFAYGFTVGLSSTGYLPTCSNDTIDDYNDVLILIAYWRRAWDDAEYLPLLKPQMQIIEEETLGLYDQCDIAELDTVLKNLRTPTGQQELVSNILLNFEQIVAELGNLSKTDDPIYMGQAAGAIFRLLTGFALN